MSFLRRQKRAKQRIANILPPEALEILKKIDSYDKETLKAASALYKKEKGL